MNLPQRDERQLAGVVFRFPHSQKMAHKRCPVALHCGFRIVLGKLKVKGAFAVHSRKPTGAGGKSMGKPGEFAELRGADDV